MATKRKREITKRKASSPKPAAPSHLVKSFVKGLFWVPGAAATLLAIYEARPKLSVMPGAVVEQADPFSTAFTVTNDSIFLPFVKVHTGCDGSVSLVAGHPVTVTPKIEVRDGGFERVEPHKSFTTFCRVHFSESLSELNIPELKIKLKTVYSLPVLPMRFSDEFSFTYIRGSDGQLHWLPPMD